MSIDAPPLSRLFEPDERSLWTPPEHLKISEWAERYYSLTREQSPIPGPWRNENAPYLALFMDLAITPGVVEVWLEKGAQGGGSEAVRIILLYFVDQDPCPLGIALPDRTKGRQVVQDRIIPACRRTPKIRGLLTDRAMDTSSEEIRFTNGAKIHLMWSGSSSSMRSNPIRIMVPDEIDVMKQWTGRDGNPVDMAMKRTRAYGDARRVIGLSTPTLKSGEIHTRVSGATYVLHFHVPCPKCGELQTLVWPQLKWKKIKGTQAARAAHIQQSPTAVWYECSVCGHKIHQDDRQAMIRQGVWRDLEGTIPDAAAVAEWPRGTSIGLRINALYYLWETWSNVVSEFIRAKGRLSSVYDFYTQTLGEPFEQSSRRTREHTFAEKSQRSKLKASIIPKWAGLLLATVDTQMDHFYVVVRAHSQERSARIWHGRIETFDDLDRLLFGTAWKVENNAFAPCKISHVAIDSGGTRAEADFESRTMEVYRWGRRRQGTVWIFKGDAHPRQSQVVRPGTGLINQGSRKEKLTIWLVDSNYFHTLLDDQIHMGIGTADETWLLDSNNDETYNRQMSNLHRVPVKKGTDMVQVWEPTTAGARHDYRDCEAYQLALASLANVDLLPNAAELQRQRQIAADAQAKNKGRRKQEDDPWKATRFEKGIL